MKNESKRKIQVVMCCSDLNIVKGGMVTMVQNLLSYSDWGRFQITYIPTHTDGSKIKKSFFFMKAYGNIGLRMLSGRVDILHLHISERGSFYRKAFLVQMAKKFHLPVILHHHGADFQMFYDGLSDKRKQYVKKIFTMADVNLLLSKSMEAAFRQKAPEAKTFVLHNAVTVLKENSYDIDKKGIVTLGRLGERKGTFDLLRALKKLEPELPKEIRIYLCGDGDVQKVREKVQEYGLEKRVEHIGWVSGLEKQKIINNAMCHVLPSYREVLPMSILETMAQGIPNISTEIASIPEVIETDVNGILIEPGNVKQLTEALRKICCDEMVRNEMSRKAFEKIEKEYSVRACGERIKHIYMGLYNKNRQEKGK